MASWIAEESIALRRRTREGPRKWLARLGRAHPGETLPPASTAGGILRRAGLIVTLAWVYLEALKLVFRLALLFGRRD